MTVIKTGRNLALLTGAVALGACATAVDATFTTADVTNFDTAITTLSALPTASSLPTSGTSTYVGLVGADINGDGTLIGDMELTADFAAADASAITGRMYNANILDNSRIDDQTLTGEIDMTGGIDRSDQTFDASGSGTLVAVGEAGGISAKVNINVTTAVSGTFQTETNNADTLTGTVDVSGTMKIPFMGTEDFDASGAEFYAQEQ